MESLTVHPQAKEQLKALKAFLKAMSIDFSMAEESPYDPAFVEKIKMGDEAYERGEYKTIPIEDLWK